MGCRVTSQLDFVSFGIPEFELFAIALRTPRWTNVCLNSHALGLQGRMQLLHIRRPQYQAVMIHVRRHRLPIRNGPDVDDGLG